MKIEQRIFNESVGSKQNIIHFVSKNLRGLSESKKNIIDSLNSNLELCEETFLFNQIAKSYKLKSDEIFLVSIASELLMQAAFISDDVFDNNFARNNKKNLFCLFGQNKAIIISTILYGIYFKIISSITNQKIRELLVDAYLKLNYGQFLTENFNDYSKLNLQILDQIAFLKCGKLMSNAASIPAIIADEKKSIINKLSEYGKLIGIALQHRDDIVEFMPSEYSLGKPSFQDLENHQPNLVLYFLYQELSSVKKNKMTNRLFIKTISDNLINQENHNKFILYSNAIKSSKKLLNVICLKAKNIANAFPTNFPRNSLIQLTRLISNV
ncbi:MAG: polyprenyl synthetase family protein [Bacteroidetes bacterium]|nr:polyprenyl synthetase family protein [Bacteroidota bacterium]